MKYHIVLCFAKVLLDHEYNDVILWDQYYRQPLVRCNFVLQESLWAIYLRGDETPKNQFMSWKWFIECVCGKLINFLEAKHIDFFLLLVEKEFSRIVWYCLILNNFSWKSFPRKFSWNWFHEKFLEINFHGKICFFLHQNIVPLQQQQNA